MNLRHDAKVAYRTDKASHFTFGDTTYWRDYFGNNFSGVMDQIEREFSRKEAGQVVKLEIKKINNVIIY